ncbi:MAG: hypothetical protein JWN64_226 [Parcubacteria group bacterium]|nr:hypothetical protein [Parcubacteria group bacterium]
MKTTAAKLSKLQNELTDLAIQIAAGSNIKLDFSIESVKQIEVILGVIHKDYKKDKQEEGVRGIALEFAAYVISVIERNLEKGYWQRDSEESGKDSFPYFLSDDSVIFPYSWCLKRIIDGSSEDVWLKFQTLVLKKGE